MKGNVTLIDRGIALPDGLILWNRLGSINEVQNSEIGVNGTIVGSPSFVAGKFGNMIYVPDNSNYPVFLNVPIYDTAGCVEVWVWNDTVALNGWAGRIFSVYEAGVRQHFLVFGEQPGVNRWRFFWYDGSTNRDSYYEYGSIPGWGFPGWMHVAFVWDKTGIGGGADYVRLYYDGVMAANITANPPAWGNTNGRLILGNEWGLTPWPGVSGLRFDNLKVYNYAKTDFSDRFVEPTAYGNAYGQNAFNSISDRVIKIAKPGEYIEL